MNRINVQDYKGAIIQYTCEDCLLSENFTVEFSDVPKVKPGTCHHFNINFLLVIEKYEIKYLLSFTCKSCNHNEMIELFNKNTTEEMGSITYSCPVCGKGNMTAGFLLENELIDLDENEGKKNNPDNNNNNDNQNMQIELIFSHAGNHYNVKVSKNILIPEAFYQLCQEHNYENLENLDIKNYKKGNEILSQFSTIEELNLRNGDVIDIEIRGNIGWNA